jgi:Carboxypeptidase regulatory-like domain/TonB dependent receptor-like, beta-barrel
MLVSMVLLSSAHAQFRASLRGVVTDPQGALVSGAKATLVNKNTNKTLVSISDANGIYQFNQLETAPYTLTVDAKGFQPKTFEDIRIIPDQPNGLDVQLEVGAASSTVTVTGSTQTLDTETASISGTVGSNEIQHMPSFGRDVLKFAQLAPGVFGDNALGSGGSGMNLPGTQTGGGASGGSVGIFSTENGAPISANGQQTQNNGVTVDGISTTSAVWGGTTIITPSEDSVQDLKVVSNSYDAENGRFSGAQIQITSKPGTNHFHGGAFADFHRPGLNAYAPYAVGGAKPLRDNDFFTQFGGNSGGPIWKNKVFAFFNYETVRSPQAQTNTSTGWYETPALAGQAPTGSIAAQYLNFPGSAPNSTSIASATCMDAGLVEGVNCRTIAGQGLDIGSPLKTGLGTQDLGWVSPSMPGVGSGLDGVADIALYNTTSTTTYSRAQYNGRLDANVTDKDHLAFAIYWVPQSSTFLNGPARQYNLFHHDQINEAYSLIWNRTFSSNFLNEARFNAAGWHWNEIASNPQAPVGLPTDNIEQIGSVTLSQFGPSIGSILNQWTYSGRDVATTVHGAHTIKFGGELTRLFYLNNCVGCGVPSYRFFNVWDFLNDAPHQQNGGFNPMTGAPTTQRQDDRESLWGLFVQDGWKVKRNLTLNLGLRWDYFGPLTAKQGNLYQAIPGPGAAFLTGLTVIPNGKTWNPQKDNFGPQIGFAWSPDIAKDKLVVRGGYGLNYNQEEIAISANVNANPGLIVFPGFTMSTPTSPNPGIVYGTSGNIHSFYGFPTNPNAIVSFGPNGLPTTGSVGVGIFPNTLPTARVHHWSLETEYNLGWNLVASATYQGSASRHIFFHENPNAYPAAAGYTLNPQISGGDYWGVQGYGNYNALTAELKHNFSRTFMADAQFTWAKSLDTSSGPYFEQPYVYNLGLNYGPSDYNVDRSWKLYGLWQPVIFHGENSWLEKIAGGWSLSGIFTTHTGFPWSPVVSVTGGSLYCGTCGYGTLFPATYTGGAGSSTSNAAFKTGSNYPNGGMAYFTVPTYTAYSGTTYGNSLPQSPGVRRNSLIGPGYRDFDATLAKAFGIPENRVLGDSARFEVRANVFNLFNTLNFNPTTISNNIANSNFGQETGSNAVMSGRIVTLEGRFTF